MGFIQNEYEIVVLVAMQPLLCLAKDVSFNRAKQHVLQHGVVRDQDIWTMLVDFMSSQQFGIAQLGLQTFCPIVITTYFPDILSGSLFLFFDFVRRIERSNVFARPLAFLL